MFECIKSGFIESTLISLYESINILKKYDYTKNIKNFIPNVEKIIVTYHYRYLNYDEDRTCYQFTINNITYGCEPDYFVYIKIKDIVIFHNRSKNNCDGKFENVCSGWNHKTPKRMLKQIKCDSETIEKYIKNINYYIKHKKPNQVQWNEEQEILNDLFK